MALFDNIHFVILKRELEECDDAAFHKLGRHRATFHPWKFLLDKFYVLRDLYNPYLIFTALGLDRNDVVTPTLVEPDIKLVDLDLADAFDRCSADGSGGCRW